MIRFTTQSTNIAEQFLSQGVAGMTPKTLWWEEDGESVECSMPLEYDTIVILWQIRYGINGRMCSSIVFTSFQFPPAKLKPVW